MLKSSKVLTSACALPVKMADPNPAQSLERQSAGKESCMLKRSQVLTSACALLVKIADPESRTKPTRSIGR